MTITVLSLSTQPSLWLEGAIADSNGIVLSDLIVHCSRAAPNSLEFQAKKSPG